MAATRVRVVVGVGGDGSVWVRVRRAAAACIALATFAGGSEASAQLYWNTNGTSGTITAANWSEPTTEMLAFIGGASVLAFARRRRRGDAGRDPAAG
jgi:hypothetical protein